MSIKTFKELLLITVLGILPFSAEGAATATAQVSANIVPITSLSLSGAAIFSGLTSELDNKGAVSVSTSGQDSEAKLTINSGSQNVYDVSVSLPGRSDDEFKNSVEIIGSRLTLNSANVNNKGEQELNFGGQMKIKSNAGNTPQSGYVYVTANFN